MEQVFLISSNRVCFFACKVEVDLNCIFEKLASVTSNFISSDRFGEVELTSRKSPASNLPVSCWISSRNARDLIRGTHERYLVAGLMDKPHYLLDKPRHFSFAC